MNKPFSWGLIQTYREKLLIWGLAILVPIFLFAQIAVLQFVCLFFLFILIGSKFYSEYLIRNIRVSRNDEELRVFRYEWIRVEIKVENHGKLPAFMLVSSDSPGQLNVFRMSKTFCTLFQSSWILLGWEGYCSERGVFDIGPAVIRGADPLGLFPFHLTDSETSRLFVYPVFRSISIKTSNGIPLGNMIRANPLFEDITRYRSLRPYNQGDEPRRINWKASAHVSAQAQSGSLLVNEYEATTSYPLMIFLNVNQNEYWGKKKRIFMERAIEAAAALCLMASRERQEIGIIFYTSYQEDGISVITPSAFTLVPILERLAALDWPVAEGIDDDVHGSATVMLDQGKRLPYGTRFVYAGPNLTNEEYITLNSLKKHHISLEYLIIDERSVPSIVPGNSPCYQMKENGYEII
jgi:uncharacterized protein (DUF58 family)